jgi:hypothetical protein
MRFDATTGTRTSRLRRAARRGERGARHRGDDGRHARLVPADAGVDDRDARRFQRARHLRHLVPGIAALDQVQQRVAVHDDEVAPERAADAPDDLDRQAHAVLDRAAPAVGALVRAGAQELVQQIAFAAHDLDAVVAGLPRQAGAAHVGVDRALDAALGQRARPERRDRRFFAEAETTKGW